MNKRNGIKGKRIEYKSAAEPKAVADGIPVFCAFDELVPITNIIGNPKNPNKHPKEQIELLAQIIRNQGWRAPITISKRSGYIVRGHARLEAAKIIGTAIVPVDYQNYSNESEELADLVADNRLAELADTDNNMLINLIQEMDIGEVPLILTGYSEDDISNIMSTMNAYEDRAIDAIDEVPEVEVEHTSMMGDLWHLGPHKLICGDATDWQTVERLMAGEKAQMVNTDPPYGVSYETQSGKFDMIKNDDLTGDDLMGELLIPAFKNYVEFTDPDAAFYIWHASSTRRDFEDAMTAAGLVEKQYIIWVKNAPVLGHADYQWAHEPCFYAEKAGQSAHFYGDRSQRTTWKVVLRDSNQMATVLTGGVVLTDGAGGKVFLNDKPPKGKKIRYIRLSEGKSVCLYPESKISTVWEVAKETGTEHPTQKPVELAIRAIDNSSKPGDLVLDFFGGSGSTLIGAEITGRRCNMIELDPIYCDVIIKRYAKLCGAKK
jgi:DNA modification methylase